MGIVPSLKKEIPKKRPIFETPDESQVTRFLAKVYKYQKECLGILHSGENIIISGPFGTGKSISSLLLSIEASFFINPISVLIYPSRESAEYHNVFFNKFFETLPFGKFFEIFTEVESVIRLNRPGILITDIFTLHNKILLPSLNRNVLFQNIGIIVLEDIEKYSGILGMNVSLLLKRLSIIINEVQNTKYPPQLVVSIADNVDIEHFINSLTGIPLDSFHIIDTKKSFFPSKEENINLVIVQPQIDKTYIENNKLHLTKKPLYDELEMTLKDISKEINREKTIGVITPYPSLGDKFIEDLENKYNAVFANSLEELKFKTQDRFPVKLIYFDLNKPLADSTISQLLYIDRLTDVYFVIPQDLMHHPFLLRQILPAAENISFLQNNTTLETIQEPDSGDIQRHLNFLKEELPLIEERVFLKHFGHINKKKFTLFSDPEDLYLFYPLGNKFTLFQERKDEDLFEKSGDFYKLILPDNSEISVTQNKANSKFFPGAIFIWHGERYQIDRWNGKNIIVRAYRGRENYVKVFRKVKSVEINNFKSETVSNLHELKIDNGTADITETLNGYRRFNGSEERRIEDITLNEETKLYYYDINTIKLTFPSQIGNTRVTSGILHLLTHHLMVYLSLNSGIEPSEIGTNWTVNEDSSTIVLYERTGKSIFDILIDNFSNFLNFSLEILRENPSAYGTLSCSRLLSCEWNTYNEPIEKLDTISLLLNLMQKPDDSETEIRIKTTGFNPDEGVKLEKWRQKILNIMKAKFNLDFQASPIFCENVQGGIAATSRPTEDCDIHISFNCQEDIPEAYVVFALAHELTHNYEFLHYCNQNPNEEMNNFTWADINNANIREFLQDHCNLSPFETFSEGFANWVASHILDFFSIRELQETRLLEHPLEYNIGLLIYFYLEKKYGIEKTVRFIHNGFSEIDENDFNELLDKSEAIIYINQEINRLYEEENH